MTAALTRAIDCAPIHMIYTQLCMGIDFAETLDSWVIAGIEPNGVIRVFAAGFTEHPRRNWTPKDIVCVLEKLP